MFQYFAFNKPYGVVSQFSPEGEKKTLADFFSGIEKNIYPVGRLDHDSEGLLILSNDKSLTDKLLNPANGHPRTYYAQVEGIINKEALKLLASGMEISIEGKRFGTKKTVVKSIATPGFIEERIPPIRVRKSVPDCWVSITLTEGKNRQVRKMFAAVGFPVLRLVRYSIGNLTIEGIKLGNYVEYNEEITELLFPNKTK